MTKAQRDKLYQNWFLKSDDAESHRNALWAFHKDAGPHASDEERNRARIKLHNAAIRDFEKALEQGELTDG